MLHNLNKYISSIFLLLLITTTSLAIDTAQIQNDTVFNLTTYNITISAPQNFTNLTVFGAGDIPVNTLEFFINDSLIWFNSNQNLNISNISFLNDQWTFRANGTGYLNITVYLNFPSAVYSIYNDSIRVDEISTNSANNLTYNTSLSSSSHLFEVYDATAPLSITNLRCTPNIETPNTAIDCIWTNPPDVDYDHVEKYINGLFQQNTSSPAQAVTISGLHPDRQYTVSTHTVDVAGNVNSTWVNTTVRTQVGDCSDTDRDVNTTFELFGILLIIGSTGFLISSVRSGQVHGIIIGTSGVIVGSIFLIVGYFVVATITNSVC